MKKTLLIFLSCLMLVSGAFAQKKKNKYQLYKEKMAKMNASRQQRKANNMEQYKQQEAAQQAQMNKRMASKFGGLFFSAAPFKGCDFSQAKDSFTLNDLKGSGIYVGWEFPAGKTANNPMLANANPERPGAGVMESVGLKLQADGDTLHTCLITEDCNNGASAEITVTDRNPSKKCFTGLLIAGAATNTTPFVKAKNATPLVVGRNLWSKGGKVSNISVKLKGYAGNMSKGSFKLDLTAAGAKDFLANTYINKIETPYIASVRGPKCLSSSAKKGMDASVKRNFPDYAGKVKKNCVVSQWAPSANRLEKKWFIDGTLYVQAGESKTVCTQQRITYESTSKGGPVLQKSLGARRRMLCKNIP